MQVFEDSLFIPNKMKLGLKHYQFEMSTQNATSRALRPSLGSFNCQINKSGALQNLLPGRQIFKTNLAGYPGSIIGFSLKKNPILSVCHSENLSANNTAYHSKLSIGIQVSPGEYHYQGQRHAL